MSDKSKNKYRLESARFQHWDYGWNASYFITICTKDRICFFGDVVDDQMALNEIGEIANKELTAIRKRKRLLIHWEHGIQTPER